MPVQNPETLEQAREMLLQNSAQIQKMQGELDTLKEESQKKEEQLEDLRTLNQKLFLQVSQGSVQEPEPEPESQESLEDFAKNLKGVIFQ